MFYILYSIYYILYSIYYILYFYIRFLKKATSINQHIPVEGDEGKTRNLFYDFSSWYNFFLEKSLFMCEMPHMERFQTSR